MLWPDSESSDRLIIPRADDSTKEVGWLKKLQNVSLLNADDDHMRHTFSGGHVN